MKILAIADIHGEKDIAKKTIKILEKEKIDLLIIAGDLTQFDSKKKIVSKILEKKILTLLIPGNHDSKETMKYFLKKYPNTKSIHKKIFEKNEIGFFGSGTVDWGLDEKKEETYKELKKTHDKLSKIKTKIMVTHMHPSETIFEYSGWGGSEGITKAIKELKPKIVICGHVHEAGGMQDKIGKTKIFNVAGVPTIIKV